MDTSKKYLAKFSKYEMGDCDGISDTTNYYLNICLRNLRMFTGPITYTYDNANDLLNRLGTPISSGNMMPGDILMPGAMCPSEIDISGVAPLVVDGVILSGDYDLIDNPEGTLLFSNNRGSFANQVLDNAGYMFIMRGGSTIRNLRLRGAMTGYIDYNEDVTLCSGVRMENEPMGLTGPYVISHCELYNFSCKAIYARANTDQVTVENCYIHHVKSTDNGRSNKGYGFWIDGINDNSNLTGPATTFAITNCIFDECKEALDAQPNPVDIIIQECTFGTFFSNEVIKKHKYNDLNIYNHPTLGQPFYDDHTPPCSTSTSPNIGNPASGNVTILKSLFYLEGEKNYPISLPYPADYYGLNPTQDKVYQVTISENTFSKAYDLPGILACQFGGYARLQENYMEESVWDYERTHGVNGQTSSTTNPPILINTPNAFSYAAGESVASQCATCVQPPEVNFAFDNVAGYVPGFTFNSDPIAYVNEGDNIKINLTTGSLGVSKVSYVVRPHPNNAAAAGNNQSSNNGYDLAQQIVGPTDLPITLEYGPITSLPEWNTDRPGLYGVDVFAVDGTTNSAYHASKMVYQPIIVAPHHNYNLIFNIKDSYYADLYDTPGTSTGVYKQVELNGNVIWREEISEGGDDWEYVSINLMTDSYDGDPIKNYFNTKSFKNTITFSIAMPDYEDVSTSTVRGVLVWVDDVYLKKYDSAQNLISDGGVEHTTKSTFSVNPEVANIWYMTNAQDLSTYFTLDAAEFPGVSAEVNANRPSTERKSGFQAIRLKLPGVWAGNVGSVSQDYGSIQPFPGQQAPANGEVVSAAVDFDYRDFLGCDDLTTNLTGTNLFVSFPDEPYSDSNGDPITLTDGKFYIDRDITLSSNNSLNNPDNLNNSTRILDVKLWGGILNSGGIIDMYNMPGSSNVYTPSSNPTEIEDAIVAIESDGGRLDLRFVDFDNNYKSFLLYEEDYDFVGAPFIKVVTLPVQWET
ncbi:MAG: hypothetical protein IPP71_04445 [Bacteroidetes bacterium]|nr:hypothetical protein [Bacteroidota bacterium]